MAKRDLRTRIICLKHKIAAHSMTDKGPIFDAYHFYNLASKILGKKFADLITKINLKGAKGFYYNMPDFYYKSSEVKKGLDDDIIDGKILITASNSSFPEVEVELGIKDRKLQMPDKFNYKSSEFDFSPEGVYKFFRTASTRYEVDKATHPYPTLSGAKVSTKYYGDDSTIREDLLLPIETGDERMWGRSTGPYVGV